MNISTLGPTKSRGERKNLEGNLTNSKLFCSFVSVFMHQTTSFSHYPQLWEKKLETITSDAYSKFYLLRKCTAHDIKK